MALATSLSSSLKVCIKELNIQLSFQMVLLHSFTLMLAFAGENKAFVKGIILVRCYLTFLLMLFFIFSMTAAQDVSLSLLENTN